MQIIYQVIDPNILAMIIKRYGEVAGRHIHLESGSYSLAAMCDKEPVGIISSYTRTLPAPLAGEMDAYIDIIEVDRQFWRQGIATQMIRLTEEWAMEAGLLQIRAWSSQNKVQAIPMWRDLGYGLCPSSILTGTGEALDGYYVVKQLNRSNPYPDITKMIKQELRSVSEKQIHSFRLLRAKNGVYVYKCQYDGMSAIAKYFANDEDKREIQNYRLLNQCGVPTIRTYALCASVIVMEDISCSDEWRLGTAEDMNDLVVARGLAHWYFALHEAGASIASLDKLYFEYDQITRENLENLRQKLPEASELLSFILAYLPALQELINKPSKTLTYNDFYWTNFIVRRDGQAALMFDYNLLGRGYRYADLRNVQSLSEQAYQQFVRAYNLLYRRKHGCDRIAEEQEQAQIDAVAAPLFELISAFEQERFPAWAEETKQAALNGTLLKTAKHLLLPDADGKSN